MSSPVADQSPGFQVIEQLVASLQGARLAPSFVFCDPFGFRIPGRLLRRLMSYPRVELFVNVMWRELDMAARQAKKPGMAACLDELFDGPDWREAITAEDFEERAEQCVQLFRRMVGAKWATYIRMLGENGRTRYFLLHLTNHEQGRELMKDCIWKTCPSGGYYARKADKPAWQLLVIPEPNLAPLREWVAGNSTAGPGTSSRSTCCRFPGRVPPIKRRDRHRAVGATLYDSRPSADCSLFAVRT